MAKTTTAYIVSHETKSGANVGHVGHTSLKVATDHAVKARAVTKTGKTGDKIILEKVVTSRTRLKF